MTTTIPKKYLQETLRRFLSDERVIALNNEIQKLYAMELPTYVIDQRHLKVIHDQRVEFAAQKIHEMMHAILIRDYPELKEVEKWIY